MRASLSIAPPANRDTESAVCRDCEETFIPSRRWGANPGLYRRCEDCREGRRLNRASKRPDFGTIRKRTKSYLRVRDYLISQAKYEPAGLELGNQAIAAATKLAVRTIVRTLEALRSDGLIETETVRIKLNDSTWVNRRTIVLKLVPQKEQE
jgi:hypothetical protein